MLVNYLNTNSIKNTLIKTMQIILDGVWDFGWMPLLLFSEL